MADVQLSHPNRVRSIASLAVMVVGLAILSLGLRGCKDEAATGLESVKISGNAFHLEPAFDQATRFKGLSGRTDIPADGGMLFAFSRPSTLNFVMRDCPVAIDIIFIDGAGRITAMHEMQPEAPRGEGEGTEGDSNTKYDTRLRKYPSRHSAQFVIELKGGTLPSLDLNVGDKVDVDTARLKRAAK